MHVRFKPNILFYSQILSHYEIKYSILLPFLKTTISTAVVIFFISIERRNRMHVFTICLVKIGMTFNLFLFILLTLS